MDFKDTTKSKKSIFNTLLLKRSTKIEPHPSNDDQIENGDISSDTDNLYGASTLHVPNPFQTSLSANSTPIKRLHKFGRLNRLLHCHSSNQSLNSNHSAPSYFLRKISKSTKKKIRNKNDRHSHPVSHTNKLPIENDTFDYNQWTDDDFINYIDAEHVDEHRTKDSTQRNHSVHIHSNKTNGELNLSRSISTERLTDDSPTAYLITSKSQEQIIVNDIDESVLCDSSQQQSPTSKSHDGNFSSSRDETDFPIGHSIAMSACRSRLRERLLPPTFVSRHKQQSNEQQQHFSFPDIAERSSASSMIEHQNSRSISCDLISNVKRTGKTESLAKNSLMAAQLINLIPTEVARERSYLANNLAVNSLLGPSELDRVLPSREIKVFVGTWNMNGQHPPKQMNDFVFPAGVEHVPDLIVIGKQESCSERFEWEVILQETLGPSHVMLHSTSLGTLHLAVFIRRDLIWFCSIPEDDCLSVRPELVTS